MATLQTPITFARQITGTNSSSLTDSKAIAFATDTLFESRKAFAKYGVDAGQIKEEFFTPTAGTGVYNYPTDLYLLKAIEVNFNNTNQGNYLPADKLDVSNTPTGYSFDHMRVNQSAQKPLYDDHGNFFEVFPTPTTSMSLTNAVKIIYFVQPTPYVTTTDTVVYPESIDPNILGYGIADKYLQSIFKFDQAKAMHDQMLTKISDTVPTLGTGGQMPTSPKGIPWSGAEF